jgi:hypothetical protein
MEFLIFFEYYFTSKNNTCPTLYEVIDGPHIYKIAQLLFSLLFPLSPCLRRELRHPRLANRTSPTAVNAILLNATAYKGELQAFFYL